MKNSKKLIEKKVSRVFGKDVYLFGEDANGVLYWLESPSWDCSWYWGFGYIETYTNNKNPQISKDINSHQHFSGFVGEQQKYDFEKQAFVKSDYIHNIFDNDNFIGFTFTENEGWKISELFDQFYLLKNMSGFCHKKFPGCHIATIKEVNHGDLSEWYDKINKEMIPKITNEILNILTPKEKIQ